MLPGEAKMKRLLFSDEKLQEPLKEMSAVTLPSFEDMIKRDKAISMRKRAMDALAEEAVGEDSGEPEHRDFGATAGIDREIATKTAELENLKKQLEAIKLEAQKTVEEALAGASEIEKDAERSGYDSAHRLATEAVAKERAEEAEAIKNIIASLEESQDEVIKIFEEAVGPLAIRVAERILGAELERTDKEAYLGIVNRMIPVLVERKGRVIRVSLSDYDRYFGKESGGADNLFLPGAEVVCDLSLSMGDCIVETDFGNVDFGVKKQLKRLEYEFSHA